MARAFFMALLVALTGISPAQAQSYPLGVGDQISVTVTGSPEFDTETRIRDDGSIGFPYIGAVRIAGMDVSAAEDHIEQALKRERLLKRPQVIITVQQHVSHAVTVMGHVSNPGRYGLSGKTTLLDVLARAGGTTQEAGEYLTLVRQVGGEKKQYQVSLDSATTGEHAATLVEPGDVINVPRMSVFYIEGAVNQPGMYRLEDGMTVMQAVAVGGGVTPRGSRDRIILKRRNEDGDIKQYDGELDVRLKPNDVLLVRERIF